VLSRIEELRDEYPLEDMAVLFRAGFQSYHLEVLLNKAGIPYQKFGGLKFTEAAHIKDMLGHLRLIQNPADLPAWQRVMALVPGIGPKTSQRLYDAVVKGETGYLEQVRAKNTELAAVLDLLHHFRQNPDTPYNIMERILEYYQPLLKTTYPDDYPKRQVGLDQLSQIASSYSELNLFLTDMTLEPPDQVGSEDPLEDRLTLSTVHSAKGLEWSAVIVLDLVEERFPSKHALMDEEAMEEERRLFYVACTRAKSRLGLSVPHSLHNRYQGLSTPTRPSPFVQELSPKLYDSFNESYSGRLQQANRPKEREEPAEPKARQPGPDELGFCKHRIFGRGKVVAFIPPNKYRVNFPSFGLKVVIGDYIELEG
jgi:DNA helicase-2/ATP-dependent DNA helicase PcrA